MGDWRHSLKFKVWTYPIPMMHVACDHITGVNTLPIYGTRLATQSIPTPLQHDFCYLPHRMSHQYYQDFSWGCLLFKIFRYHSVVVRYCIEWCWYTLNIWMEWHAWCMYIPAMCSAISQQCVRPELLLLVAVVYRFSCQIPRGTTPLLESSICFHRCIMHHIPAIGFVPTQYNACLGIFLKNFWILFNMYVYGIREYCSEYMIYLKFGPCTVLSVNWERGISDTRASHMMKRLLTLPSYRQTYQSRFVEVTPLEDGFDDILTNCRGFMEICVCRHFILPK